MRRRRRRMHLFRSSACSGTRFVAIRHFGNFFRLIRALLFARNWVIFSFTAILLLFEILWIDILAGMAQVTFWAIGRLFTPNIGSHCLHVWTALRLNSKLAYTFLGKFKLSSRRNFADKQTKSESKIEPGYSKNEESSSLPAP